MSVTLSRGQLPVIDRAGLFPLLNAVHDFSYRNPTNALHLYAYQGQVRIGSKEYAVRPGDITCIQSGTVYSFASDSPGKHWCIHYYDTPNEGAGTIVLPTHFCLGANSHFYRAQVQLISRLCINHDNREEDDLVVLEARFRLKALLLSLHNLSENQDTSTRNRSTFSWDHLLGWVDENLEQPLTVPMLAEVAKISSGTLAKKFKEAHKTTLSQYLLHRRIDKAKSLLATTTLAIYEIGTAVGIPDPQYFNKQFRKLTGISPSRYRDDNREYLGRATEELAVKEGSWKKERPD